jgi:hypothetical protein
VPQSVILCRGDRRVGHFLPLILNRCRVLTRSYSQDAGVPERWLGVQP